MTTKQELKAFEERKKAILDLLYGCGPMSRAELAELLKISNNNAMSAISRLKIEGCLHITKYEHPQKNGNFIPMYKYGKGKDANKPKPKSRKEVTKKYREIHAAAISARRYKDYHKSLGVWAGLLR
jgi:predicted ArsR family transcriptional regulator